MIFLCTYRPQIDKCLELVRERFHNNPEVSLEQTNSSMVSLLGAPNHFPTPQHALMSNIVLPVFVSALESGSKQDWFFLPRLLEK